MSYLNELLDSGEDQTEKIEEVLSSLRHEGLALWSRRLKHRQHPDFGEEKHEGRYIEGLIKKAATIAFKGGNGGYGYWRVFEAVYDRAVEVDALTDEVYLEGTLQPLEDPLSLFVKLDALLVGACPLATGNKISYFGKFLRDHRVNRFQRHLKDCLVKYPDDLPDWGRMAEILFGATDGLSQAMLECWLVAHVKRTNKPGHTFKHMLVLSGRQSIGKSPFFQILARMPGEGTHNAPRYYWVQSSSTSEEHAKRQRSRRVIVEAAETEGLTSKVDVEAFKNMLSENNDTWKVNHQEVERVVPRSYVFGGSVNSVNVFKDKTGNERFWLVECGDRRIDLEWLEDNLDHIRATAYRKMLNGAATELSADMIAASEERNQGYMSGGSVEDAVADLIALLEDDRKDDGLRKEPFDGIAIQDAQDLVKVLSEGGDRVSKSAVIQALANLNYFSTQTKVNGRNRRLYRKGGKGRLFIFSVDAIRAVYNRDRGCVARAE